MYILQARSHKWGERGGGLAPLSDLNKFIFLKTENMSFFMLCFKLKTEELFVLSFLCTNWVLHRNF